MKEWCAKIRERAGGVVGVLRGNMLLLFVTALVIGGLVKVGLSQFATMGYNDYLVEHHGGLNFEKMKEDVTKRNQDTEKNQNAQGAEDTVPEATKQ